MGTVSEAVPVARLVEIFSPMPRIAPPPLGSESVGADGTGPAALLELVRGPWSAVVPPR